MSSALKLNPVRDLPSVGPERSFFALAWRSGMRWKGVGVLRGNGLGYSRLLRLCPLGYTLSFVLEFRFADSVSFCWTGGGVYGYDTP